jgi:hypothetical protein
VTKLICERGICDASEAGILSLFPEQREGTRHKAQGTRGKQKRPSPSSGLIGADGA